MLALLTDQAVTASSASRNAPASIVRSQTSHGTDVRHGLAIGLALVTPFWAAVAACVFYA